MNRQLADLARQGDTDFPYYFLPEAAEHVLTFFSALKFTKGKWARDRQNFEVQDWQAFILACLFGWYKDDGTRRFQRAYIEVPRKNGKTELAAGVMNYCFFEEMGSDAPEIYSAATTKDQARIAFKQARKMALGLKNDYVWADGLQVLQNTVLLGDGVMCALSSEDNVLDGKMASTAVIDEYHAHKTSNVLDVIESGMGSRENPLIFIITTAGSNINGPCYSQSRRTMASILAGQLHDERQFGIIYTIDDGDRWDDPAAWVKANPNLGVSFNLEYLEAKAVVARNEGGTKIVEFQTKYINVWSKQVVAWVKDDTWMMGAEKIDHDTLIGRRCFAGLDLSSTQDITALCLFFPAAQMDEKHKALWWFWLPEEQADIRRQNGIPYPTWIGEGLIETTPGNAVDHDEICTRIIELAEIYPFARVDVDPWNSLNVELRLRSAGIPFYKLAQTLSALSAPTKEVEKMVNTKMLQHGGNKVMRWMMGNVAIYKDANENIRAHKGKSAEKIDGVAALVNAVAGWMTENAQAPSGGSYLFEEDTELIIL